MEALPLDDVPKVAPGTADGLLLSDFGSATTIANATDSGCLYPVYARPPEVLLDPPLTSSADIWALGCAIYHLMTLTSLFYVDTFETYEEQIDVQLQVTNEVLGIMPDEFLSR
ncbi:hypothetical protein K461DRAFT_292145 [Myriangium duriaei CBS 260.36]|uniref:Protein kinase domain-containing protein n=1 Tax=Myriangium duriaei CBS 260.36 TaxID=1168546 RepID=A0A9P4J4H9_9PEZI|nr:hypothetical protein K461DRAFT_292145 [Myriangium duriaei CBS 260.36]